MDNVRIIPDLSLVHNLLQGGVLHLAHEALDVLRVSGVSGRQVDGHARGSDLLGNVDELVETRHTHGHVLGRHTSIVEGVEGHLGRGLTNRLCSQSTDALTRVDEGAEELALNLTNEPLKGVTRKAHLTDHTLGSEDRAEVDGHEQSAVTLRLGRDEVVTSNHTQAVAEDLDLWKGQE